MSKLPIGLQLYSVRHDCAQDLPAVLQAVKTMGYDGVEFAGYYNYSAPDLRQLLDDNGLVCCGTHTGLNTLLGEELPRTVEFNQILGNPYLIVPGLPGDRTATRAAWLETAGLFNEIAARLAEQNMVTGYHNHHTEFTAKEGEKPWDTFFGNTVESVVMQLDMGNGLAGGADLTGILRAYPGRAKTVHLKPYHAELGRGDMHAGFRPLIGDDTVPWAEVFDICETSGGTAWYIVEYESDLFPPLEAVDKCLQALRAMGK